MGGLGAILGRSWAILGALGAVLGQSWGGLGRSWGGLGRPCAVLGGLGAVLGRSWGVFGRSWGDPGRSWDGLGAFLGAPGGQHAVFSLVFSMLFEKYRFLKNNRFKSVLEACFAEFIRCSRPWACFGELVRRFPFSAAQVSGRLPASFFSKILIKPMKNQ